MPDHPAVSVISTLSHGRDCRASEECLAPRSFRARLRYLTFRKMREIAERS